MRFDSEGFGRGCRGGVEDWTSEWQEARKSEEDCGNVAFAPRFGPDTIRGCIRPSRVEYNCAGSRQQGRLNVALGTKAGQREQSPTVQSEVIGEYLRREGAIRVG